MEWCVEFSEEFERWWDSLTEGQQESVNAKVILLQAKGPSLPRPHSDLIVTSKHSNMKELIVQHQGNPLRILYAFDSNRCAQLLLGGDKTGNNRWYADNVPIADKLFDQHLNRLLAEKKG
jgi:hypothetical protein